MDSSSAWLRMLIRASHTAETRLCLWSKMGLFELLIDQEITQWVREHKHLSTEWHDGYLSFQNVPSWRTGWPSQSGAVLAVLNMEDGLFSLSISCSLFKSGLSLASQTKGRGKAIHPWLLHISHLSRLEPRALQTFSHIVRPPVKGPQKPTETDTRVGERQAFCLKVHRTGNWRGGQIFLSQVALFHPRVTRVPAVAICLSSSVFISQTSLSKSLVEKPISRAKMKAAKVFLVLKELEGN